MIWRWRWRRSGTPKPGWLEILVREAFKRRLIVPGATRRRRWRRSRATGREGVDTLLRRLWRPARDERVALWRARPGPGLAGRWPGARRWRRRRRSFARQCGEEWRSVEAEVGGVGAEEAPNVDGRWQLFELLLLESSKEAFGNSRIPRGLLKRKVARIAGLTKGLANLDQALLLRQLLRHKVDAEHQRGDRRRSRELKLPTVTRPSSTHQRALRPTISRHCPAYSSGLLSSLSPAPRGPRRRARRSGCFRRRCCVRAPSATAPGDASSVRAAPPRGRD